jgi:hypothetical protein
VVQTPLLHTSSVVQRCPHWPQFVGSLLVSTQAPLHSAKPAEQVMAHSPAWQDAWPLAGAKHSAPHWLQLLALLCRSTHESPQRVSPSAH